MNLVVPVNLQALRVTPNDASLITKRGDLFSGPTASFDELPWRDPNYTEHAGRISKANLSANVVNSLSGDVASQLDAGIHLHWALPDAMTRGVQQVDGALVFPAVPNRWLVTRVIQLPGALHTRQWVVESDYLMTEEEYTTTYYPAMRRKAVAIPVGWSLVAGNDPKRDGGALYYPPSRRMGKVFELAQWQPTATPPGAAPDLVRHLDELERQANAFAAQGRPSGPLKAVGATGPSFAAYYPDSRSVFGFHDLLNDLPGLDLGNASFQVSYMVVGWHSHASDDPLSAPRFTTALSKKIAAAPAALKAGAPDQLAETLQEVYRWHYDPAQGTPSRCLYNGQVIGMGWDTTGAQAGGDPKFPKCFLTPPGDDPTVRLSVGSSPSSAMAALIKHEWAQWASGQWSPGSNQALEIDEEIERDLEFLIDALQLGLLHQLGSSNSLPQLEEALHKAGFGSRIGGGRWAIRQKASEPDKSDPQRFSLPDTALPEDGNDLAGKLAALNALQARLDAVLDTADSCRRQIFVDWYHYITAVGSGQSDADANKLKDDLKTYVSGQILDLWAKQEAAFGLKSTPSAATGNLPAFYSRRDSWLSQQSGRYASDSPPPSLAGQVVEAANAIVDVLAKPEYALFELARMEKPRFWQSNEPVVVATGDGLKPAQRNGTAKVLPCRLSPQLVRELKLADGGTQSILAGADAAAALAVAVPDLSANQTPEARDTAPLLDDVRALLGEACLLDYALAPAVAGKLGKPALATNLQAALRHLAGAIGDAWKAGAPEKAVPSMPAILADQVATAGTLQVTASGQAPQGAGLTFQPGPVWQDPFLPLFLVWEVSYQPFEKGAAPGAGRYDQGFLVDRFQLDSDTIDLVAKGKPPTTQGGAAVLGGFIPLSSRVADPLLDQIQQYVETYPEENPQLSRVVEQLRGKPLLSQALSGVNPALLARAQGMQLVPFNPFYDAEAPATRLGAQADTLDYANVLTHFVAAAVSALSDEVPLGETGFNPLRSGFLTIVRAEVVDVFGRKRRVVDQAVAADAAKVVVSSPMLPPPGTTAQVALPPRLGQPARLSFEWVSGTDGRLVTNDHPSTSPVSGWVVSNYLDNSLMLFAPSGRPLGSLGVFGGQAAVSWQSAPGNPARPMATDMAGDDLAHFLKFATFILGKDRAFFRDLMTSIEDAHTYILSGDARGDEPYAVLMGRPLALVRAELRLELAGLPAFNTDLGSVGAAMEANGAGSYDWTRRDEAGLLGVDFPVRLGDRNKLSDGLVAYLLDGSAPYDTLYAPAAPKVDGTGVRQPAPDTLRLKLHAAIDPPATPYAGAAEQAAGLRDVSDRTGRTKVTLLMDPRASVHATTGILPVKEIDLPPGIYAKALQSIEVAFVTHPVLRGSQGLELPAPEEPGFDWKWTMGVKQGGAAQPRDEDLLDLAIGDRAHFRFSPQVAQDGWLKLVPKPPQS